MADPESRVSVTGAWRLLSNEVEFRDTGERVQMFGRPARGHLIFTEGGRMIAYVEALDRKAPRSDADCALAYRTMCAYSGRYQLHGDKWVTFVDGSWNVDWCETEQVRYFHIQDGRLVVTSAWYSSPLHEGRWARACLTWERDSEPHERLPSDSA
jgi:hypothetical protein